MQATTARQQADKEGASTAAVQAELEALALEFRSQHAERQTLARQWDDATALMRRCYKPQVLLALTIFMASGKEETATEVQAQNKQNVA